MGLTSTTSGAFGFVPPVENDRNSLRTFSASQLAFPTIMCFSSQFRFLHRWQSSIQFSVFNSFQHSLKNCFYSCILVSGPPKSSPAGFSGSILHSDGMNSLLLIPSILFNIQSWHEESQKAKSTRNGSDDLYSSLVCIIAGRALTVSSWNSLKERSRNVFMLSIC